MNDWMMVNLGVGSALRRPREERVSGDCGRVAWAATLDDDLREVRDDFGRALVLAASKRDPRPVDTLMRDSQCSAVGLVDPVSGPILRGEHTLNDFVEVARPTAL